MAALLTMTGVASAQTVTVDVDPGVRVDGVHYFFRREIDGDYHSQTCTTFPCTLELQPFGRRITVQGVDGSSRFMIERVPWPQHMQIHRVRAMPIGFAVAMGGVGGWVLSVVPAVVALATTPPHVDVLDFQRNQTGATALTIAIANGAASILTIALGVAILSVAEDRRMTISRVALSVEPTTGGALFGAALRF